MPSTLLHSLHSPSKSSTVDFIVHISFCSVQAVVGLLRPLVPEVECFLSPAKQGMAATQLSDTTYHTEDCASAYLILALPNVHTTCIIITHYRVTMINILDSSWLIQIDFVFESAQYIL